MLKASVYQKIKYLIKCHFLNNVDEHNDLMENLYDLTEVEQRLGLHAAQTLRVGRKILFCGNAGSAADSQHLAAELTGRFINDCRQLAAVALSTDSSAFTCISNDCAYKEVFALQIIGLGRKWNLLIGITTSGNPNNIIRAIQEASKQSMHTVCLLGRDSGKNICAI